MENGLFNEIYYLLIKVSIVIMQSKINNKLQFGQALNPLKSVAKVSCVDNTSDRKDIFTKIDILKKLWDDGSMDYDLIRYLHGITKISRQGKVYNAHAQTVYASPNWSDLRTFEFNMLLTANAATNINNMYLWMPMQIKKKKTTNVATDIDNDLITVNNFFAHFLKEIDIKRYGDDVRILPTNNAVDVYRYYDAMLKHIPNDALKTFDEKLLYSRKLIKLSGNNDRRPNNDNDADNRTDDSLTDRLDKFSDLISKETIYKIPLRFLVDIGLVNFPIAFDTRFISTLLQDLNKLFESNAKVTQYQSLTQK